MPTREQDQKLELTMGRLLQAGVIVACAVVAAGGILYFIRHGAEQPSYTRFHGEPSTLESLPGILQQARTGSARGIIQFGALLMIATPVLRVVFAVIGFARMQDWKFTAISLTVLALLLFGLFGSH